MPVGKAPYRREHKQTKGRGRQPTVNCGFCGRITPRHKTFVTYRGFRITDPLLRREIRRQGVSLQSEKIYACVACARHRKIVQKKDKTGRKIIVKRRRRRR